MSRHRSWFGVCAQGLTALCGASKLQIGEIMKFKHFGSVSHGTMREEDLIPAFIDLLEELDSKKAEEFKLSWFSELLLEDREETLSQMTESLFELLEGFAPTGLYFGAHPGDGSDYGYWVCEDQSWADDLLKVSDTSEVPLSYVGEVLHCNERGNLTLYFKAENTEALQEVWSCV